MFYGCTWLAGSRAAGRSRAPWGAGSRRSRTVYDGRGSRASPLGRRSANSMSWNSRAGFTAASAVVLRSARWRGRFPTGRGCARNSHVATTRLPSRFSGRSTKPIILKGTSTRNLPSCIGASRSASQWCCASRIGRGRSASSTSATGSRSPIPTPAIASQRSSSSARWARALSPSPAPPSRGATRVARLPCAHVRGVRWRGIDHRAR